MLGCRSVYEGEDIIIDSTCADCFEIPRELAHELRSSVFLLGPLIARFKRARIAYPGGCDIGLRPVDLHLSGLKRLGVSIRESNGYIYCECEKLCGNEIMLDCPSVGATENIMLAAVLAEGDTVIKNAARRTRDRRFAEISQLDRRKSARRGQRYHSRKRVKKLGGGEFQLWPTE